MIDLAISNSGDLAASKPLDTPKLTLSWKESEHPTLMLTLKTGRNMDDAPEVRGLKLSFDVSTSNPLNECSGVHDIEELRQRIMILLRTEDGDAGLGTLLRQQKHKDILDEEVQKAVYEIVLNAVSEYLEEPYVYIRRGSTEGPFSCQNLNIYVYNGQEEIYDFELEEL